MNETKNYSITKSGAVILEGGANRGVFTAGADDLVGVDQFLHPVCTPADDTRAGEHRGVELQRKIQHAVNEAAVEVDVCGYTFVNMALLADDLRSQFLDHSVQPVIFLSVFFFCHKKQRKIGFIYTMECV